jgi:hypothetical protein
MTAAIIAVVAVTNLLVKTVTKFPWVLADSYTHLYIAREMRRRCSWRIRLDRFLYDERVAMRLDYPPLFGLLLAALWNGRSDARPLARWLPAILDTAGLVAAAACALWLGGGNLGAVLAAGIWALAPCTYAQTLALSGRPLGALLATLTFSALAWSVVSSSPASIASTATVGALLFLANRLAIQAWAFLTLVFCICARSLVPLEVLALALGGAIVLTAGDGLRVHIGHWVHMRRLRRLMSKKRWHQLARVRPERNVAPPPRGLRLLLRVVTFLDLPFIWLLPLAWLASAGVPADPLARVMLAWLATLALAGTLIQAIPSLRFIGEGFRYFEFAIVPLATLLAEAIRRTTPTGRMLLAAVAALAGALAVLQIRRSARASFLDGVRRDERAVQLAQRLRGCAIDRLLVLPFQYAPLVTVEAEKSTLMMLQEKGGDTSEDFYPVMERPPAAFVDEFRLGGVFLDRRYAAFQELGLTDGVLVDEEGPFAVYALAANPAVVSPHAILPGQP